MGNQLIDLRDFYQVLYEVIGSIVFKNGWVELPHAQLGGNLARRNEIQLICRSFQSILKKKNQVSFHYIVFYSYFYRLILSE
jgi:hypothetical protein